MLRAAIEPWPEPGDRLWHDWEALHARDPHATPFHSPTWQDAWRRTRHSDVACAAVRQGSDLVALLPIDRRLGGAWLRAAGTGPSDYLDPLLGPETPAETLVVLFECLRAPLVDLCEQRRPWVQSPGAEAWPQSVCLKLQLLASFDAYMSSLSKSLRQDLVRGLDPAKGKGRLAVRDASPADVSERLEQCFAMHARRWRRRGLPGAFGRQARAALRLWAPGAVASGRLWLRWLECDGAPIGYLLAMREGRVVSYYQAALDAGVKGVSPGTILIGDTIRRAIAEGASTFDFLRGDEPYKRRWKPQSSGLNVRCVVASGALGGAMRSVLAAHYRVEQGVRRRFEGRGLWATSVPPPRET